jgi:hypothetical protein
MRSLKACLLMPAWRAAAVKLPSRTTSTKSSMSAGAITGIAILGKLLSVFT